MEITQGQTVKTSDGTIGKVVRSVAPNGVRFHLLRRLMQTPWGLVETQGYRFVSDGEIVAVQQTTATTEVVTAA